MVAQPNPASALAAPVADVNTAFGLAHCGISDVLRNTLAFVLEKVANEPRSCWFCQKQWRNCVFKEQKSGLGWAACTAAATRRGWGVFFGAHE